MAEASRDQNRVTTLLGVNDVTGVTQPIKVNDDGAVLVTLPGGAGDVSGPATSTEHAIARYADTTGKVIEDSGILISDTNVLSPATSDAAALGSGTLMWSDLFLASGSVVSWDNGDVTITHSADTLTFAGGTIALGTATATGGLTGNVTGNVSGNAGTVTGLVLAGGSLTLAGADALTLTTSAATDVTLPTTGTLATLAGSEALTNKTVNGLTISSTNGTLTIANGSSLVTSGANSITLTSTGATNVTLPTTGMLATLAGVEELDNKTLDASVAKGTWTASSWVTPAYTAGGVITLAENSAIALDPAGSADGKYTGITVTATAGYSQAFGDLVYLDPTDSRWEAVDANAAAGADGDARGMLGMVVVAGTDGNACTILLNGIIRADAKFPSFTINNPIYASETAAAVTQTQPTTTDVVIRIVGAALTADEMYFNPDWAYITHT